MFCCPRARLAYPSRLVVKPTRDLPPPESLLAISYALVGASALVHEVAWQRLARSLLGGDARALAVTLVAILGGMGFGGLLAPRIARRWGALGGFARVEALAAVFAAALPWIAPGLDAVVGVAYRSLGEGPGFTVASVLVAALLFAPPALAMGAGLPLLAEARAPAGRMSRDAGVLYAAHALGGAAGGLCAAFVLVPDLGVPFAVLGASALQMMVAAVAWYLGRRLAPARAMVEAPPDDGARAQKRTGSPPRIPRAAAWLLGAALAAGIGTAALQTLAARLATLAVGPSVQGFALVAGVYVLALSVGAGVASPFVRHSTRPAAMYAALALGSCASLLAAVSTFGDWPTGASAIFADRLAGAGPPWAKLAWMVALPLFGPVALAAAAFPFGVAALERSGALGPKASAQSAKTAARDVGWLVAAGAAGNVIGVPLAVFAIVPSVGLASGLILAALALAVSALLAAAAGFRGAPKRPALAPRHGIILCALSAVAAGALVAAPRTFDADALTRGPFLYAGPSSPELGKVTFVHHGVEATVTVRDAGDERLLQIDGKVDASAHGDASTQLLVGLLPGLLAASPERVLVIGLGTGTTADAVRSVPAVESVEVAELVDGVRWAAPRFARWNGRVLDDPRVEVRPVDGAMLLRHGIARWDVIVSEPSNPWVAGMGDLYSEQTFRAARERLRDGGVLATWFHVYSTDLAIVRSIAATFASVFPDATLWELVRGQDYLLVGRRSDEDGEPIALDLDRLAERARDGEVRSRLERAGIANVEGLLGRLVAFGDGVAELGGDAPILSATDGSLEARAARSLYRDASRDALLAFADIPRRPGALRVRARTEDGLALASALTRAVEAGALGRELVLRATERDEDGAIAAGEQAVGLLPDDPSLRDALATLYLARGKTHALAREDEDARDVLITVIDLEPSPRLAADAHATLGDLHLRGGEPETALGRYQTARRLSPAVVELTERIADCLDAVGATEAAARERDLAARLRRAQM